MNAALAGVNARQLLRARKSAGQEGRDRGAGHVCGSGPDARKPRGFLSIRKKTDVRTGLRTDKVLCWMAKRIRTVWSGRMRVI